MKLRTRLKLIRYREMYYDWWERWSERRCHEDHYGNRWTRVRNDLLHLMFDLFAPRKGLDIRHDRSLFGFERVHGKTRSTTKPRRSYINSIRRGTGITEVMQGRGPLTATEIDLIFKEFISRPPCYYSESSDSNS